MKKILICILLAGLVMAGVPATQAATPILEYEAKAAFLFNFAKFVEWPPQSFADNQSPIVIGVLGSNPFNDILEGMVKKQTLNGRPVLIKKSLNVEDLKTCQLLFISRSEQEPVQEILGRLRGVSVLTISEIDGFTTIGGIIQFVKKENKIRFRINHEAAKEANLKISSKLLSLAEKE